MYKKALVKCTKEEIKTKEKYTDLLNTFGCSLKHVLNDL
jgi:hypothetical protein